jgi:hypothetical protein
LAQYQASSGHLIELSIVGNIRRVSQILDNKCHSIIPSKTWKVLKASHALSNIYFGMVEAIQRSILAKYQASVGHLIELSILGNIRRVSPILDNKCCSNIPTNKLLMLYLRRHTLEWWKQFNEVYWPNIKQVLAI